MSHQKKYFILGCHVLSGCLLGAQPTIDWQKAFVYSGTSEMAHSVVYASGDYFIAGSMGFNYQVYRMNPQGSLVWSKTYGGSGYEEGRVMTETSDGSLIVAGCTASDDGDVSGLHGYVIDYWMIKIDLSGNHLWQKCLGGTGGDNAYSVIQCSDGGYALAGYSFSDDGDVSGHHGTGAYEDAWVAKTDSTGNLQWQRSLGGSLTDIANSIAETPDGSFYVSCKSFSDDGDVSFNHGNAEAWIVKLDQNGNTLWEKSYGGNSYEAANSLLPLNDGGAVFCGTAASANGDVTGVHSGNMSFPTPDFWLVRFDDNGNILWDKCFGGSGGEIGHQMTKAVNGKYLLTGFVSSADGDVSGLHGTYDYWLVQTDTAGNLEWQKCIGGSDYDIAYSIATGPSDEIILAGYTNSTDGDAVGNYNCWEDFWIVKLSYPAVSAETEPQDSRNGVSVYPNPFSGSATLRIQGISVSPEHPVRLEITDVLGRTVEQINITGKETLIYGKNLESGMYFYRVIAGDTSAWSGKIVFLGD